VRYAYAVRDVRAAEANALAGAAPQALMDKAASGVATLAIRLLEDSIGRVVGAKVLLLIGSGDNGGDALYAGVRLADRGAAVTALLVGERTHQGGLAALREARCEIISSLTDFDPAEVDLVIDGIVGIGGRHGADGQGGLRGSAADVAGKLPASAIVLAVDLPSGVDPDSGEVSGAHITADVTAVCGALKIAHVVDPGASAAGICEVIDLGLDMSRATSRLEVWQGIDVANALPRPTVASDKYSRGVLGVVAGSAEYPGAGALVCTAALSTGVGMIRYLGEASESVIGDHPEVVRVAGRVQAWVVGPGLVGAAAEGAVAIALASDQPLVLDAGALALLPKGRPQTLITPHAGELASLLGIDRADVESRSLHFARLAASTYDVTVLLKGSTTIVAAPDGRISVNPTGTPKLATAGSGDVLAGAIGALAAGGLPLFEAATVGAWLHGLAGRLMSGASSAEIALTIRHAIASLPWQADLP